MSYTVLCVSGDYKLVFLCNNKDGSLIVKNGIEFAKNTEGLKVTNLIRLSTRRAKEVYSKVMRVGVDCKVGDIVASNFLMDFETVLASKAYKINTKNGKCDLEALENTRPSLVVYGKSNLTTSEWINEKVRTRDRHRTSKEKEEELQREAEEKKKKLEELARRDKQTEEDEVLPEIKPVDNKLVVPKTTEFYDGSTDIKLKIPKEVKQDIEVMDTSMELKIESSQFNAESSQRGVKEKNLSNKQITQTDIQGEFASSISINTPTGKKVTAKDILKDIEEDEDDIEDLKCTTETPKEETKLAKIKVEYNPNCPKCHGSGSYKLDGLTIDCLCFEEYYKQKQKLKEIDKAIDIKQSKLKELVDLEIIPEQYKSIEFNGERQRELIVSRLDKIKEQCTKLDEEVQRNNAKVAGEKRLERVRGLINYYKQSESIAEHIKDKTYDQLIEELINTIKDKLSSGFKPPLNLDEELFYRPIVANIAGSKLSKMSNVGREDVEYSVQLNHYTKEFIPLANELIAACRTGMKIKNSYMIGGDKGFGKKAIAYQCIKYMYARGENVVPYISLSEIAEYLAKYAEGLVPRLNIEYSGANELTMGDHRVIDDTRTVERKQFKWMDFLKVPVLFTYISGTANLRRETEMLQMLLNIRGAKCLPTIVFVDNSINFFKTDVILNNYYWKNMMNYSEEEGVYDTLLYKSAYIKIDYKLNCDIGLKKDNKIIAVFDYDKLLYINYKGSLIYSSGLIVQAPKVSEQYVNIGKDI